MQRVYKFLPGDTVAMGELVGVVTGCNDHGVLVQFKGEGAVRDVMAVALRHVKIGAEVVS